MTSAAPRRRAKTALRRAIIAGIALAALALAPGLVLRGPVAVWVVARVTRGLCGHVAISGAGVDVTALPRALLGRAVGVRVEGVRVIDPAGEPVLTLDRLDAEITIEWAARRVVVEDAVVANGTWRLAIDEAGQASTFVRAFARLGPTGREGCLAPAPPRPRPPAGPSWPAPPPALPEPGWALSVRAAQLRAVDTELAFPGWGLTLPQATARGDLRVGARGAVSFDVIDAVAAGGRLRLGPEGTRWTFAADFDRVAIERVAGDTRRGGDVVLVVDEATARGSRLVGRAVFGGALGGRRAPRRRQQITIDARWTDVGRVLPRSFPNAELDPRWATAFGADPATLSIALEGPYAAPRGNVRLAGGPLELALDLAPARTSALRVTARGLDVGPLLPRALRPLFGGRVDGHVVAHGRRLIEAARASIEIDGAVLDLTRTRPGPWPARWRVRVGAHAPAAADASAADLNLTIARAAFEHGGLSIADLRLAFPGAALETTGRLQLIELLSGGPMPSPIARASITRADLDLARVAPPGTVAGQVRARGELHGTIDDLALTLDPGARSEIIVVGEHLRFPKRIALRVRGGDELAGAVSLSRAGGGDARIEGRVVFDGDVDAHARIDGCPLSLLVTALGGHARLRLPAIGGEWDAAVHVQGPTRAPRVDATMSLARVRVADQSLGDGEVRVRSPSPAGDVRHVELQGEIVRGLSVAASADVSSRRLVASHARVTLDRLRLDPLLPARVAALAPVIATGTIEAAARAAQGPSLARARATAAVRLDTAAGRIDLTGELADARVEASASGRLAAAPLARGVGVSGPAAGVIDVEAHLSRSLVVTPTGPLDGVRARAVVVEPVVVRVEPLAAPITVASGSELSLAATTVRTPGLQVTTDGLTGSVAGEATVALTDPAQSRIDVTTELDVDVARAQAVAPRLLPRGLALTGHVGARGRVRGTVARPLPDLALELGRVVVAGPRLAAFGSLAIDGSATLRGRSIDELALRAQLGSGGTVQLSRGRGGAAVTLDDAWPPGLAGASLRMVGRGLTTARPLGVLSVRDARFDLTLDRAPGGRLTLRGDATVDRAVIARAKRRSTRTIQKVEQKADDVALLRNLDVDVVLSSPRDGIRVSVPVLPDVTVGLACRLRGPAPHPTLAGRVAGAGAYSSVLLAIYDWFTPLQIRQCRLLP